MNIGEGRLPAASDSNIDAATNNSIRLIGGVDMNPIGPLWNADRLNDAIANSHDAIVAFAPIADGTEMGGVAARLSGRLAPAAALTRDHDLAAIVVPSAACEAMAAQLRPLPAEMALHAVDPEPWSTVLIRTGAMQGGGPFRDVSAPIRDWLLRAIRAGGRVTVGESAPLADGNARLASVRLPALVPAPPGPEQAWLSESLELCDVRRRAGGAKSRADLIALAAGLWQMNDFLERSHELSQSIEGAGSHRAGDYWHAILHRREPDYSNAKYWLRRVGRHPIHPGLAQEADRILQPCRSPDAGRWRDQVTGAGWDSFAFVDLCRAASEGTDAELSQAARQIQFTEMLLLLAATYVDATA